MGSRNSAMTTRSSTALVTVTGSPSASRTARCAIRFFPSPSSETTRQILSSGGSAPPSRDARNITLSPRRISRSGRKTASGTWRSKFRPKDRRDASAFTSVPRSLARSASICQTRPRRSVNRDTKSATLKLGLAWALLEEGLDGALEVLAGEEVGGVVANRLVGGGNSAFAEAAQDVLGHRVGLGRAGGELGGVGPSAPVEVLIVEKQVDHAPVLHLLGAEELAADDEVTGATAASTLGEALGAAHRRGQADDLLDQAELGGTGSEDQVAAERQLESRRQRQRVGGEDDRQRQRFDPLDRADQLVPEPTALLRRQTLELVHVDTSGDRAALSAEEQRPRRVGLDRRNHRLQIFEEPPVEEVERRAVEGGDGKAALLPLEPDEAHASAVAGLFSRTCQFTVAVATRVPSPSTSSISQGNSTLPSASSVASASAADTPSLAFASIGPLAIFS